ncbi:MAG TPA: Flp pilus assembly protein CpaB [Planctomycetaceae bacterium]|nr:Flp pilus assembly protein CpaB [Planctomycetaceae bacterium]
MRPKSLMLLLVAGGCGLLAFWAATQNTSGKDQQMVKVLVVAVDNIPSYEPLKDEMVGWLDVPQSQIVLDAVTRREDFQGKALNVSMNKGEMITKSRLTDKFNASTEIQNGKRLVTVNVDISTSHSGQIRPGDIVDVITTYQVGELGGMRGGTQTKTKVVLSKIEVFSIDSIRSTNTPGNEDVLAKTVSLLVDPEQALPLMMASQKGKIHLALRNKLDSSESDVPILTEDDFDKINSSDPDLATKSESESVAVNYSESEEYKQQKKELDRLNDLVNKLKAEQNALSLQSKIDDLKKIELPSWTVTIYDRGKKDKIEFKEETEKEATLPEAPKGDLPATDDNTSGNSTTSPEGDQPMNTALKADTGDK